MNIPIRTDLLKRRRRTRTQTKLDIEGKAKNVAGAFEVTETAAELMKERPDIRRIVLIDDVFTSGSTLHACFVALRSVFPPSVRISVVTLAFVGGG
jgi:predicted amidophosphoribosyltransferase